MRWRLIHNPITRTRPVLRLADHLGRSRGRTRWIDALVESPPSPRQPDLLRWHDHDLAAIWIGHATVLLRIGDMTVLTDPVFSAKVGLSFGVITGGPRRFFAPALSIAQLPPLDLILVTHAHFDHLDRPSLHRLPKDVPVITSEHNADLIRDLGFAQVSELRWNESLQLRGLKVTARRVNHWGARTVLDRHRGFSGFLLDAPRARTGPSRRILCGGDSAFHDF
ncbi:MAG: MBL fold metallo-hydrolase, partial [Planctomycetota bacterium]|nr:MBL fold metallo-hydrolase [Planctomycetota bacterium]